VFTSKLRVLHSKGVSREVHYILIARTCSYERAHTHTRTHAHYSYMYYYASLKCCEEVRYLGLSFVMTEVRLTRVCNNSSSDLDREGSIKSPSWNNVSFLCEGFERKREEILLSSVYCALYNQKKVPFILFETTKNP
jgi:hypothetical protein